MCRIYVDAFASELGASRPQLVAGSVVHGQFWFRDPPDPVSGTGLTGAVSFTLAP